MYVCMYVCMNHASEKHHIFTQLEPVFLSSVHTWTCFKHRATAMLSWLNCSTTWFQTSNLIQSNKMAITENKTQNKKTV